MNINVKKQVKETVLSSQQMCRTLNRQKFDVQHIINLKNLLKQELLDVLPRIEKEQESPEVRYKKLVKERYFREECGEEEYYIAHMIFLLDRINIRYGKKVCYENFLSITNTFLSKYICSNV